MGQIKPEEDPATTGGAVRTRAEVTVTPRGAARWERGHPWIYASDLLRERGQVGLASVRDDRGLFLGQALYSPASEIRLRLLERGERPIDVAWWRERIARAAARRRGIDATAYRVVHGEADRLPSLVIDRYDRWLVAQILSGGLETLRSDVVQGVCEALEPEGVLLRNDVGVRRREGLSEEVTLAFGDVPREIEVEEARVRYYVAPWTGQKTGAFLDQRPNRVRAAALTRPGGRALDCFSYHGSFALHLARRAGSVVAVEESGEAIARGTRNAALNNLSNIEWRAGDAFEVLRHMERARERFDVVVVDPPAFAKSRSALPQALRGYKEINLRGMRLLAPGGILLTASCSYHVRPADFFQAVAAAAQDSGRRLTVLEHLTQGVDHPEIVTIPETGYLKGIVLQAE